MSWQQQGQEPYREGYRPEEYQERYQQQRGETFAQPSIEQPFPSSSYQPQGQQPFPYQPQGQQPPYFQPAYPAVQVTVQHGYMVQSPQPMTILVKPATPSGERIGAVCSYVFGWFSALVCLFLGWQNRYVRFHALQSLLFFGAVNMFDIVLGMFMSLPWWHHFFMPGLVAGLSFVVVNFIAFISWIVLMIYAANGKTFELPIFGQIAAGIAGVRQNENATPKS